MKQIVNGKLYDTDTAEKICDIENVFKSKSYTIYKTSKGALFLWNNNNNCVNVVSHEAIKECIGKTCPDKYIELFGEVEEA